MRADAMSLAVTFFTRSPPIPVTILRQKRVVVKILSRGCQKTVKMAIRSLSVPRLINLHVDLHFLVTEGGVNEAGVFHKIPRIDDSRLAEIFAGEVLSMLVRKELLSPEWAERILSWPHSGFNVHRLVRAKTKPESERVENNYR